MNEYTLEALVDELRKNVKYRLDMVALTLVEALANLVEHNGEASSDCGNVRVWMTKDVLQLLDNTTGEVLLAFNVSINMPKRLSRDTKERIIAFGREVWQAMTDEEKEQYFVTNGGFGFVEDILRMLHITSVDTMEMEEMHDAIVAEDPEDDADEGFNLSIIDFVQSYFFKDKGNTRENDDTE